MAQQNVKTILSNKDKQNTYKHLLGKYRKAVSSECYLEALLIVYAMIEDRLRSIIYHSGGLANSKACLVPVSYLRTDKQDRPVTWF